MFTDTVDLAELIIDDTCLVRTFCSTAFYIDPQDRPTRGR